MLRPTCSDPTRRQRAVVALVLPTFPFALATPCLHGAPGHSTLRAWRTLGGRRNTRGSGRSAPSRSGSRRARRAPTRMRVVDLGCGTGELTAQLHQKLQARETVGSTARRDARRARPRPGCDSSSGMRPGFAPQDRFDLVFSNAALHWILTTPASSSADHGARTRRPDRGPDAMTDGLITHQTAGDLARSPLRPLLADTNAARRCGPIAVRELAASPGLRPAARAGGDVRAPARQP